MSRKKKKEQITKTLTDVQKDEKKKKRNLTDGVHKKDKRKKQPHKSTTHR